MDSKIAPKTRAIVNIDMLFYMNNDCISHYTFKWNFLCTVFLIEVCILFTLNRARHTPNAIGHCIVYFVFDMVIFIETEDPL